MERNRLAWICGLSLLASQSWAGPQYASVQLGEGVLFTPALDVTLEYDDNIFRVDNNKKSSVVTRVEPSFEIEVQQERTRLGFSYAGNYGIFASSSDDNYDNHTGRIDFGLRGARSDLDIYGAFVAGSDPRGTGPSDGLGDNVARNIFTKPTEYHEWQWGVAAHFGTRGTRSNLRLSYDGQDREYQNFRQFTQDRDRTRHNLGARLGYALTGKTQAVLDLRRSEIDYDLTPADGNRRLDSKEHRITAGLTWEATGRTSGTVLLGWKEKDFDSPTRDTSDGFTWELGLTWAPRPYSVFDIYTRNDFQETDNVGSAKDISTAGINWTHRWSDRLRTTTGFEYAQEDYEDFVRKDDFYRFNFAFDYDFQRWLSLGLGVRIASRDSNVAAADYDRNIIFVRAQMGL